MSLLNASKTIENCHQAPSTYRRAERSDISTKCWKALHCDKVTYYRCVLCRSKTMNGFCNSISSDGKIALLLLSLQYSCLWLRKNRRLHRPRKLPKSTFHLGTLKGFPSLLLQGRETDYSVPSHIHPCSKEKPQAKSPSDIQMQLNQPEAAICICSLLSSHLSTSLLPGQSGTSFLSQFSHLENGDRTCLMPVSTQ